jgi:hypothetical protein
MATPEELLQAILDELRSSKQPLGFGHPPKPRYIYANRQYSDSLWYFWNGAKNEHEPIEFHALTGIIEKIEIEEREFRGKPDHKINLFVRADRAYVIQSGCDTQFAKGLIYTLSKLPVEAFRQPITISVEAGDTEQVLFCKIYNPATGQAVFAPYDERVNWNAVTQKAISKIAAAHGKPESSPEVTARPISQPTPLAPPLPTGDWEEKPIDLSDVIAQIDTEIDRIGWTKKQGSNHLQQVYGKKTRAELIDYELLEFLGYLRSLPAASRKQSVSVG